MDYDCKWFYDVYGDAIFIAKKRAMGGVIMQ